jgi:Holliday junction resolvase RusA-like endonuclease
MQAYNLPIKAISHNMYYRIMRNRYVISPKGRQFREDVKRVLESPLTFCHDDKCEMIIEFHFKDNRKRDLDNLSKALIDACKGILFVDDSLIQRLETKKIQGQEADLILIIMTNHVQE